MAVQRNITVDLNSQGGDCLSQPDSIAAKIDWLKTEDWLHGSAFFFHVIMISGVCAVETVTLIRSLHFCQTLRCFYAVGPFQLYVIWPCALVCLGLTRLTEDSCPSSRWNAMCRPCCEYQLIQCRCPSKGLKVGYTVPCCRNALNQCDPCIIPPGTTSVTATHLTS